MNVIETIDVRCCIENERDVGDGHLLVPGRDDVAECSFGFIASVIEIQLTECVDSDDHSIAIEIDALDVIGPIRAAVECHIGETSLRELHPFLKERTDMMEAG